MTSIQNTALRSLQEAQIEWFASLGFGALELAVNWHTAGQAFTRQWMSQTEQTLASWNEKGLFPAGA